MRDEVTYARDTSKSLPRKSNVFSIMVRDKVRGRQRLKLSVEFAESLKHLLGKADGQKVITMEEFKYALDNFM